ncbi:MAG: hypothetical protein NXI32_24210 [bacterium]|nr:hypothetical protein [bacterium]
MRPLLAVRWFTLLMLCCAGCHHWNWPAVGLPPMNLGPPPPIEVPVSNPANVGEVDPDFLWRMVVDTVDDHFRIDTEQPVRRDNVNWLEGRLTTFPEISGTSFEPWRRDAAMGFERLQSTFQTVRRTATVRVIPDPTGYQISVEVIKEQEDVDQSQYAAAGAAAQRHDGTIVRNENQIRQLPITLGWYEIGRDRILEQRIMEGILGRVSNVEPPRRKLLH